MAGAITPDEVAALAEEIRRTYGARLPAAPVRESHNDRERRQEETKYVLETVVMTEVNEERISTRRPRLSEDDEDRVIESVLSSLFLLPRLMEILDREPLAEDLLVLGSSEVRVDRADGTMGLYPPLVRSDYDLQQQISDVATQHHRPFSFESPWVDVQLNRRLRFHGQGFDIVSRPAIFIRVHRALGATFADLYKWGSVSAGLAYFLGEVVPAVKLSMAISGVQGSGKTTVMRASALGYGPETRMATVESDYELSLAALGLPWTQEMQARIPVTSSTNGISTAELMPPLLRMRADVNYVGEVRGKEGSAAVRAANVGQGTVVTVHGNSAMAGLDQLTDRMIEADNLPREHAARLVYGSFDLAVQCSVSARRQRWIEEVIVPAVQGAGTKYHTLYRPDPSTGDLRARASDVQWDEMLLAKIKMSMPDFDLDRALDDTMMPFAEAATTVVGSVSEDAA